jgi:hypothetical protein
MLRGFRFGTGLVRAPGGFSLEWQVLPALAPHLEDASRGGIR